MSSSYRFSGPFVVRLAGLGLCALGALVLVLAALVTLLSWPTVVLTTAVLVALALLLLVLVLGVLATRRGEVVRFDETGYRIRYVRGAGVRVADWKQVEDVATTSLRGAPCVVIRHRNGRTSTVPVSVLAGRPEDFVRDLQEHLNRGHGYRPVPRRRA